MKKLFAVLVVVVVVAALADMAFGAVARDWAGSIGQAAVLPFRIAGLAR